MALKTLPLSDEQLKDIVSKYQTPFHTYDEKSIRESEKRNINVKRTQ